MDDWNYCVATLPKVSRTFALNISVLKGDLHGSILVAYLFCRTVDTVEDAAELDPAIKVKLLGGFIDLMQSPAPRTAELEQWISDCAPVDGSPTDLDLLKNIDRVFRIFDTLPASHQKPIRESVCKMSSGMAYFQDKFEQKTLTPLEDQNELEDYCYFVAGVVGEMLCELKLAKLTGLPENAKRIMRENAVSFGLGLQMTNISKDVIVDQSRGWSYVPKSFIEEKGLSLEAFQSGSDIEKNLEVMETLLLKTTGHLRDALKYTLAIPRQEVSLRLFCIWPLWMAAETVATLHNNRELMTSDAQVKISRKTVRKILRRTPLIAFSNFLLQRSFDSILKSNDFTNPPRFDLKHLKSRLEKLDLPFSANSG
ncbi:MAG: squalene/phytoene synthase family protein [Candidatus Nitrohelix vancouverensis]|uniref:Squalene/phytoene synthase family protein n=1 Tax=Candidatus Nitrohelix vancouverensis TaxID=2705534 RepID=A0A7T0G4R0_9BACT|nr:MAG: squalene/phytoene synthase family protein [Candidatus Nitrohelix vancouverensis]